MNKYWKVTEQYFQKEPKLKNIFNIVPKTAFEVKAIEKFGRQHLLQITKLVIDGSRPGTFNVPIVDASQYNKLGMDNLLYMKPFRGIIFNSLQRENQNLQN
jgi:uncharacterized protein (DUF885 family)